MSYGQDCKAAEDLVRSLGVGCANLGVCQIISALAILHANEGILHNMAKLDELVAERFDGATAQRVEKNLRDGRDEILMQGDQEALRRIMGYLLRRKPSVANFLDALDSYMEQHFLWPSEDGPAPHSHKSSFRF